MLVPQDLTYQTATMHLSCVEKKVTIVSFSVMLTSIIGIIHPSAAQNDLDHVHSPTNPSTVSMES
jgi:hypothetical protein